MGSKPAAVQITPDELPAKPLERPSWMVLSLSRKPRFFRDWKLATRACRRDPNVRPPYALRLIFADEMLGSRAEYSAFEIAIPRGTFSDLGFFSADGDFEDELARAVHQIESGRIYLADNGVCERLNLDEGAWPIQAILARAWGLPGHDSDFVHASYDELAYRTASEVVTACREVMPGISPGALAAVCLSFQVGAHLQDRFRRFGRTSRAKVLAGDSGNPGRLAESAMYFAQRLLEKYAVVLDAAAAGVTDKSATTVVIRLESLQASVSTNGEKRATGQTPVTIRGTMTPTRERIEEFLLLAGQIPGASRQITKSDFWGARGYRNDRQFRRYQAEDPTCSAQAKKTFTRLIDEGPQKFVALLQAKGMLQENPHFS